jgi:hypothetical protein
MFCFVEDNKVISTIEKAITEPDKKKGFSCQHYKNPTKRVSLVQSGHHHYLIEHNLFTPEIVEMALNNNHSLINVYLPKSDRPVLQ